MINNANTSAEHMLISFDHAFDVGGGGGVQRLKTMLPRTLKVGLLPTFIWG